MSTTYHQNDQIQPDNRPVRCLRHHVWMAACSDCREAHIPLRRGTSGR